MKIKTIIYEDFSNYKKPSMFIGCSQCDWKCCVENNISIECCQNSELYNSPTIELSDDFIIEKYIHNKITKAIVIGGLEPMLQYDDILSFITSFRQVSNDDVVIYTGYYMEEVLDKVNDLKKFKNIIIKFGRYIPNRPSIKDKILGIELVSDNQYANKIS